MSKIIVTFQEVIELNHRLLEKGLSFQLHLRDACGSQSFVMEPLDACSCEGRSNRLFFE